MVERFERLTNSLSSLRTVWVVNEGYQMFLIKKSWVNYWLINVQRSEMSGWNDRVPNGFWTVCLRLFLRWNRNRSVTFCPKPKPLSEPFRSVPKPVLTTGDPKPSILISLSVSPSHILSLTQPLPLIHTYFLSFCDPSVSGLFLAAISSCHSLCHESSWKSPISMYSLNYFLF